MESQIKIQHLLPDNEFVCFVIPALFSQRECEQLLNDDIKKSFQKAISNYPTYYRNNERLVVDSDELSYKLFEKVKPYLPETIETISVIQSENGLWTLSQLNNRLRFCKYSANQYFHRHLDGIHYRSETEQSKLTFMIYLNSASEFEGGRTLFYKTKESEEIWASYIPRQGDLIVFDHNVWHEGEVLQQGEKFVLRSDILYSKQKEHSPNTAFYGHLGYIWKLLKFDASTLLSGGRDKIIKVWNTKGELIQSLQGHGNSILCIEKIDEKTFISGSRDRKIIIWSKGADGLFEKIREIEIHSALVLSLCRLTNTSFASTSGDNTIKICNVEGQILKVFAEHVNWVWEIIRLSQTTIASASEDQKIKIWSTDNDHSIVTFEGEHPTFCLAHNEASNQLISGDLKGFITIRTLSPNFKEVSKKIIQAHVGIIRTIKIISDDLFATGAEDNKVKIWDFKTHECLLTLEHQNFVQSLELLDDKFLLSASYDGTIKSIDLGKLKGDLLL